MLLNNNFLLNNKKVIFNTYIVVVFLVYYYFLNFFLNETQMECATKLQGIIISVMLKNWASKAKLWLVNLNSFLELVNLC